MGRALGVSEVWPRFWDIENAQKCGTVYPDRTDDSGSDLRILAAVAGPVYLNDTVKSANKACPSEAKAYATFAMASVSWESRSLPARDN